MKQSTLEGWRRLSLRCMGGLGDYVQMLGSLIRGTRAPADPGSGECTQAPLPQHTQQSEQSSFMGQGRLQASVTLRTVCTTPSSLQWAHSGLSDYDGVRSIGIQQETRFELGMPPWLSVYVQSNPLVTLDVAKSNSSQST